MKSSATAVARLGGVLRLFVGLLFVVSAVAKLVAVDAFEVYIFTYGFFPLTLSYLIARLCIVAELIVGVALVAGLWPRLSVVAAALLTLAFTCFLCYAALSGRTDSCHCMGNLVEFNPVQSMVKNAILLLMLCGARFGTLWHWRPRWYWAALLFVALAVVPFVISVPDNWRYRSAREVYNAESLSRMLATDDFADIAEGRHAVAFVTPGCGFCKLATEKMLAIGRRHDIDADRFVFISPRIDSTQTAVEAMTPGNFAYTLRQLPVNEFFDITYGQRPLIMLVEADSVVATYHLRNIDERQIADWLNGSSNRQ